MATPSQELQLPTPTPLPTGAVDQWLRLVPSGPQLGLVVALAAAVTLAIAVLMWAARPSMVPYNPALNAAQTRQLVEQLNGLGQHYEISTSGMALVPQEDLASLKLKLGASFDGEDLSTLGGEGSSTGVFSTSQEQRRQLQIRSLERELAKTISQIQSVSAARVHLAVPRRSVFIRDVRARPSASVKLEVASGRVLDAGQISGIANLVATSVPHLESGQVSIVDQHGKLLNRDLNDPVAQLTNQQFSHKHHFEMLASAKIENLLDASVGPGNYRVQLDASFDFSRIQESQTTYQQDPKAVRSMHETMQRSANGSELGGIPGALTNQPPEGGTVTEGDAEALQSGEGASGMFRREVTRNMEVGENRTTTTRAPWRLERVSVALLVDDKVNVSEEGETTRTPREQKELDALTELVKTTIGFDEARGDTVTVINQSFTPTEQLQPIPPLKLWEQAWFEPVLKTSLAGLAIALLVLMVIRPTARALIGKQVGRIKGSSNTDADADGEQSTEEARENTPGRPALASDRLTLSSDELLEPPARIHGDILNLAREMAKQDPKRVATVLKKWLDADE